jgi:hypothetical protein
MGFSNIESRLKAIDGKMELSDNGEPGFSVTVTCQFTNYDSKAMEEHT